MAGNARGFWRQENGGKRMRVQMGFVRGKPPRMEVAGALARALELGLTGPFSKLGLHGPKRSASLDLGPLRARALASPQPPSRERRRLPGGESVSG